LLFGQCSCDTPNPELHASANLSRQLAPDHDVRNGKSTARLQHPEGLSDGLALIRGKVDHTVRDDDIDRAVRQRDRLDLTLQELDILHPGTALVLAREREHVIRHVQAIGLA
jgi:hypothetical protein